MKRYISLEACENLIKRYLEKGGTVTTIEEGVLGLGKVVCKGDGLKTSVIIEEYINAWSSSHKVRMYNKCPKKYETS